MYVTLITYIVTVVTIYVSTQKTIFHLSLPIFLLFHFYFARKQIQNFVVYYDI